MSDSDISQSWRAAQDHGHRASSLYYGSLLLMRYDDNDDDDNYDDKHCLLGAVVIKRMTGAKV